ncbi:uncharacterized protein PRCAT00004864001 [Priceomyces carsonii]|uniref:uncharacterized protein n=1 Tax=Priceomyces carsonii TaxID=28549 RepID=UPI002ED85E8F|nr:unnamed protein product [Priceomyces carsonii]
MNSLNNRIKKILPYGSRFKLLNVKSVCVENKSPINYRSNDKPKRSLKVKHYIALLNDEDIILVGIEIYVYLNIYNDFVDQLIFVSKCDTTGLRQSPVRVHYFVKEVLCWLVDFDLHNYCDKVRLKPIKLNDKTRYDGDNLVIKQLNQIIMNLRQDPDYFKKIPYYNSKKLDDVTDLTHIDIPPVRNIKLSLFTRSSEQYLFPESAKNKFKHVLDGRQLLSWWIKVIDGSLDSKWSCKLMVPGSDSRSIKNFIEGKMKWTIGNIYTNEADGKDDFAIWKIPLFPDDPKGRFLENLVVEGRAKSVTSSEFWTELGFRQEFRLGILVGLIGCELNNQPVDSSDNLHDTETILNYRKLTKLMRGENYNSESDVEALVQKKIPELLGPKCYSHLTGLLEIDDSQNSVKRVGVTTSNDLTSSIKKKPKVQANNLTNLIRRKK